MPEERRKEGKMNKGGHEVSTVGQQYLEGFPQRICPRCGQPVVVTPLGMFAIDGSRDLWHETSYGEFAVCDD